MNSIEKSNIKAKSIINAINSIKLHEYNSLDYGIEKWELTFELHPNNLSFSEFSRIYIFNNQVDPLVNKIIGEKFKLLSNDELENGITTDLRTFLILKYPYSQVPELDHASL